MISSLNKSIKFLHQIKKARRRNTWIASLRFEQIQRERCDDMSKGVKTIMGKPTETTDLMIYWELTDSGLTVGEPAQAQTRSSEYG